MSKFWRYILPLFAALTLTNACRDDFDDYVDNQSRSGYMHVLGYLQDSRAARTWWHTNDSIGVSGNGYTNIEYKLLFGAGSYEFSHFAGDKIYYNSADDNYAQYIAYYPYKGTPGTAPAVHHDSTIDQSEYAQPHYDFLYADSTYNVDTIVAFNFHHKMTALYFLFVDGEGKPAADTVRFWIDSTLIMYGTFTPMTGYAIAKDTIRSDYEDSIFCADSTIYPVKQLILFPQDSFGLDTNRINFTVRCDCTLYTGHLHYPKLEPGNQYDITVICGGGGGTGHHHERKDTLTFIGKYGPWYRPNPWTGGPSTGELVFHGDSLHPWMGGASAEDLIYKPIIHPWEGGPGAHGFTPDGPLHPWSGGASAGSLVDTTKLHPWAHGDSATQDFMYDVAGIDPWGANPKGELHNDNVGTAVIHPWGPGESMHEADTSFVGTVENWGGDQLIHSSYTDSALVMPWDSGYNAFKRDLTAGSNVNPWNAAYTAYTGSVSDTVVADAWGSHKTARAQDGDEAIADAWGDNKTARPQEYQDTARVSPWGDNKTARPKSTGPSILDPWDPAETAVPQVYKTDLQPWGAHLDANSANPSNDTEINPWGAHLDANSANPSNDTEINPWGKHVSAGSSNPSNNTQINPWGYNPSAYTSSPSVNSPITPWNTDNVAENSNLTGTTENWNTTHVANNSNLTGSTDNWNVTQTLFNSSFTSPTSSSNLTWTIVNGWTPNTTGTMNPTYPGKMP